ncbi:MAG: threonine/serine dehydratase [Chloroflexi bacterium AL-N5]|nr:threonine/serine dehydratase [Chloroflexi bacterium AL-N5]
MSVNLVDVQAAAERIRSAVYRTPLVRLPLAGEVYAKAENLQRTHSFKLRGAYNFLAQLPKDVRARGVTAHSSGNHAQGVACAAHLFGVPAAIAIPEGAPEVKVAATRAWGAEVVRCGGSSAEREAAAQHFVAERGYSLVPPFNHPWIIAGQGTVGLEIAHDLPEVANVLICVGGGGLIAGTALVIKALCPNAKIIGVEPELAADATESFAKGEIVSWDAERTTSTIADGVRTQALGQHNFRLIQQYVDAFVTVSEHEILEASAWYLQHAKLVVEPTGALAQAAYIKLSNGSAKLLQTGPTVLMVSGGNVDTDLLERLLQYPVRKNRL